MQKATAVFVKVLKTVEGLEGLEYDRKTILAAWQKALATIVSVIGQSLPSGEPAEDGEDWDAKSCSLWGHEDKLQIPVQLLALSFATYCANMQARSGLSQINSNECTPLHHGWYWCQFGSFFHHHNPILWHRSIACSTFNPCMSFYNVNI